MSLQEALRAHFEAELAEEARLCEAYHQGTLAQHAEGPELLAILNAGARRWLWSAMLGLAAAAALMFFVWPAPQVAPQKPLVMMGSGGWQIDVAAQRGAHSFVVESGAKLLTDDALGFFVSADTPGFVAIYYVTDADVVVLAPTGDRDGAVPSGQRHRLREGARITAGEGCEWIVTTFADTVVDTQAHVEQLKDPSRERCEPPQLTGARMIKVVR